MKDYGELRAFAASAGYDTPEAMHTALRRAKEEYFYDDEHTDEPEQKDESCTPTQ